jgi:predicted RNase H-like HicB family nuclease
MQVTVHLNAHLPVKFTKRKTWVLASCPILDVHSQGASLKEAKKNLAEALKLFFVSCFERGTLDAALKECGFKAIRQLTISSKKPVDQRGDYIDVPIPFVVEQKTGDSCHA